LIVLGCEVRDGSAVARVGRAVLYHDPHVADAAVANPLGKTISITTDNRTVGRGEDTRRRARWVPLLSGVDVVA